jgi:hypothetical protein
MKALHLLVLGQSNVANHGEGKSASHHGWVDGGNNTQLTMADPIYGGTGQKGSIWPRVAEILYQKHGCTLGLTLHAVGGASVADWAPHGRLHPHLLDTLPQLRGRVTHIVWHQGERDALLGTSPLDYAARLTALHSAVACILPVPWIICRASYRADQTSANVLAAQSDVANTIPGCIAGPDTDTLGPEFRQDGTHFNAKGLDHFAAMMAQTIGALC